MLGRLEGSAIRPAPMTISAHVPPRPGARRPHRGGVGEAPGAARPRRGARGVRGVPRRAAEARASVGARRRRSASTTPRTARRSASTSRKTAAWPCTSGGIRECARARHQVLPPRPQRRARRRRREHPQRRARLRAGAAVNLAQSAAVAPRSRPRRDCLAAQRPAVEGGPGVRREGAAGEAQERVRGDSKEQFEKRVAPRRRRMGSSTTCSAEGELVSLVAAIGDSHTSVEMRALRAGPHAAARPLLVRGRPAHRRGPEAARARARARW